jgi:hypothetical protein
MPGGAAGVKMIRLRVTRDTQKNADIIALFSDAPPAGAGYYFQNGQHCLQYLDANYGMALTQSELDDLDELWRIISIQRDIGIHEFTITQFWQRMFAGSMGTGPLPTGRPMIKSLRRFCNSSTSAHLTSIRVGSKSTMPLQDHASLSTLLGTRWQASVMWLL